MFGIGSTELIVILIVALIVIGPAKLPEMARSLGKALGEFRRVSTDVKRTIEMEAEQEEQRHKNEEARKELFPDEKKESASAEVDDAKTPATESASEQATEPSSAKDAQA